MAEDNEYMKLPLDERCVHKLWKARVHGYDEAAKHFRRIDDEKAAEWNKYLGLIKKFVSDSNVAAQEKGLEASLAYIENAFVAGKTVGEIMPIVITKCIGTTKARTKELAVQICLAYIEIEKQDVVLEELLKGAANKNPKIAAASVTTITQALREFGSQVLNIKLILEKLPTLLEDRDKSVRDESKVLAVELFKWIGPVLKMKLASLKPIQLQELENEFEKVKDDKPTVERYRRSQQSKKSKETEDAVGDDDDSIEMSEDDAPNEVDPLDFVQPVDVLSKLPKDFYEKLESKKWQERKESLDCLEQLLTNAPKLESAEYGDLVRVIKRVITKDSNVVLVGIAAKCMALLAQGLKEKFQPYASQCLSPLLEKFKEKKQNVVLPLRDAVDAIYDSTTLESAHESIIALMGSKNPAVKAETITFLTRCFTKCTPQVLNKKLMKTLSTALLKTLNESDPSVRDHSAEALGTAWKVVGENAISPFLGDVDSIKMAKINEASKTAVILAKPPKVVKKRQPSKPTVEMCEKPVTEKSKRRADSKPMRKPVKKTSTFVIRSSSSTSSSAAEPRVSDIEKFLNLGSEQNERVDISSKITQSLVEELGDKDWKVRTEAVNKLQEIISEAKLITNNLGDAVPAISERLADSNAKLVSSTVALCESIAVAMGPSCRIYIRDFFPGMLQRLSDNKNNVRSTVIQCINTWGDAAGYKDFFEGEMIASALKTGSPTLRSELWTWLAEKLPELQAVPKDELMACLPHLYTNLEDRNADVRKSASEVVYGFMIHLGYQAMLNACKELKPASVNNIKGMLEKIRANIPEPTAPLKGPKAVSAQISVASSQTSVKTKSTGAAKSKSAAPIAQKKREEDMDLTPLLKVNNLKMQRNLDENKLKVLKWNFSTPREEFVEQLRDQMTTAGVNKTLIVNMFHHDFKYHLKAIDSLSEDLANNSAALISNLDLVLKWLTIKFFDTNPSVILRGLEYLNSAFRVLTDDGYNMMEFEASSFLPYLVLKTGDPKDTVRSHVKDIFDTISSVYPISKLFTYIMDGLKSKNARQRTGCLELLGRLIENYGLSVCQPSPAAALKEIAKQISDRDNAVRNAALNCVVVAYFITGEKIRQMIGQISDKDMDLLEERIKRSSKSRPPTIPPAQAKSAPQSSAETTDSVAELPSLQVRGHLGRDEGIDAETHGEQDTASLPVPSVMATENGQRYKHFGLDQKVIDAIEATAIVHPKPNLVEYDETYLLETVIPITRTRPMISTSDSSDTLTIDNCRSSSIEPKNLEEWITGLGTWTSEDDIIEAIQNIELVLMIEDKNEDLCGMETYLISQTINQLSHLSSIVDPGSFKCYRHLFSLLMKFFAHTEYSVLISDYQLQQLLTQLTNLLVKKRSEYKENWNWFQKVVNNLVLKILECSEHTAVICALLRLLYDCVASMKPNAEQHHQELIMKCIWKIVKYIPDWDADLAYDKVLAEINRFLNDFPPSWWKKQGVDTPLRTYKTIVHAMVSFRGAEIMTIAHGISGFNQQSELFHYIDKLLRHMKSDAKTNSALDREIRESEVQKENLIPVLQLPKILEKIGNQEETQQGLRMLYEFQKSHPEVDIEKFLTKSTKYFKQYVYNGLEALRNEKEGNAIHSLKPSVDKCVESEGNDRESTNGDRGSGGSPKSDTQRYQQILKMLNRKNESLDAVSALNPLSPAKPTPLKFYRDSENEGTTLEHLRQKLCQLKGGN